MNSYRQSLYTGAIRVLANLVMVAAVFVGMYMSAHSTAASELVFSVWFFGISLPVWGAAFLLTRLVRRPPLGKAWWTCPNAALAWSAGRWPRRPRSRCPSAAVGAGPRNAPPRPCHAPVSEA